MTFEEFFTKKRIDLGALGKAEPGLLSEFKTHFEQMGEKSFDHTKKYWFNKLRLLYHLAPELKPEKVHIANPLAEQTITESLVESSTPVPKVGFKSRFNAGMAKPAEPEPEKPEEKTETQSPVTPKVGFTPRFKAGVTKPVETGDSALAAEPADSAEASPTVNPKVGFTPRFKGGVTKPASNENPPVAETEKPEQQTEEQTLAPAKIGFTPRFKAGVAKAAEPVPHDQKETPAREEKPEPAPPKIGFTPRFKAGVTKAVEPPSEAKEEPKVDNLPEDKPSENSDPKPPNLGFKPRFNTKPKGE